MRRQPVRRGAFPRFPRAMPAPAVLALLVVLAAQAVQVGCRREAAPPAISAPEPAAIAAPAPPPERLAGIPAATPDAARLAAARALMAGGGREESCGPYRLLTDAEDPRLLAACTRLGQALDAAFESRFGVRPVGRPAEALVLFRSLRDYRRFVEREGRLAAGYAGFTSASDGLVVLYAETKRSTAVETLAHEMAHLVERRTFGSSLPPWLSEGLADAIGDTATEEGIGALAGTAGAEAIARRLRAGRAAGLTRPLAELAALRRSGFDKGARSYDYEQSALTVRYLLLDPALGPRFRAYLGDLARAERYDAGKLREALGRSWEELERGFAAWLG